MSYEDSNNPADKKQVSHSPGPWTIEKSIDDGFMLLRDADGHIVFDPYEPKPQDVSLIAAAPELLAAAKAIERSCPCDSDTTSRFQHAWDLLLAAITKAEGTTDRERLL